MHDPRLGSFFAVDPLAWQYPYNSPYAFSENRVVDEIELEGLEFRGMHGGLKGMDGINVSKSESNPTLIRDLKMLDKFLDGPGGGSQGGGIHMMASYGTPGVGTEKLATAKNTDYSDDEILALIGAVGGSNNVSKIPSVTDKLISVNKHASEIKQKVKDAVVSRFHLEGKTMKSINLSPLSPVNNNVKVVVTYSDGTTDTDYFNPITLAFMNVDVVGVSKALDEVKLKSGSKTVVEDKVVKIDSSRQVHYSGSSSVVVEEFKDGEIVVSDTVVKN